MKRRWQCWTSTARDRTAEMRRTPGWLQKLAVGKHPASVDRRASGTRLPSADGDDSLEKPRTYCSGRPRPPSQSSKMVLVSVHGGGYVRPATGKPTRRDSVGRTECTKHKRSRPAGSSPKSRRRSRALNNGSRTGSPTTYLCSTPACWSSAGRPSRRSGVWFVDPVLGGRVPGVKGR